MTTETTQALRVRIEAALDYSGNYANANPYLSKTGREHILGLCKLLRDALDAIAAAPAPAVEFVDEIGRGGQPTGYWLSGEAAARQAAALAEAREQGTQAVALVTQSSRFDGRFECLNGLIPAGTKLYAAPPAPARGVEDEPIELRVNTSGRLEFDDAARTAAEPENDRG